MGMFTRLKEFYHECVRVLKVTKKPTNEELKTVTKVSGLGILVIGLMGFIVMMIYRLIVG